MERIELLSTIPQIFAKEGEQRCANSEVWLKRVTFERGQHYLIEADSGVGKSSLCSYIYGNRTDYNGTITFDNKDVAQLNSPQWRKLRNNSLSMLFQDLRLFSELTALENIALKNNLTHFKNNSQIVSLFEELSIADKLDSKVGQLSFGQQQRVAFIRSLCQPFDFILLDEPISHLDAGNSATLATILLGEAERQGAAIIATSIGHHLPLQYDKILKL